MNEIIENYLNNINNFTILKSLRVSDNFRDEFKHSLDFKQFKELIAFYLENKLISFELGNKIRNLDLIDIKTIDYQEISEEDLYCLYFIKISKKDVLCIAKKSYKLINYLYFTEKTLLKLIKKDNYFDLSNYLEHRNSGIKVNKQYLSEEKQASMFNKTNVSEDIIKKESFFSKSLVRLVSNYTAEEEIQLIEKYGLDALYSFKNPIKEKSAYFAFEKNPDSFQYFKKEYSFTKEAVERYGYIIQWIKLPSKELLLLSLSKNMNPFKHVLNHINLEYLSVTDIQDLLLEVVKLNSSTIRKIPFRYQTIEIAKEALLGHSGNLKFIDIHILKKLI